MSRTHRHKNHPNPHPRHRDHHLWRNGRLYWIAFTVHLPGWRKGRVRRSLGTADLRVARRRRDVLLREWNAAHGGVPSLRFAAKRAPLRDAGPAHAFAAAGGGSCR